MRRWQRSAAAVAAVLAIQGALPAAAAEDGPAVRRARARLEVARTEATLATQAYLESTTRLARTEQRIASLEARIPRLEARIDELRDLLARRAVALYSGGAGSGLVAVERAIEADDVLTGGRAAYLAETAHADLSESADEYDEKKAELQDAHAELEDLRREQREQADAARLHADDLERAVERANADLREAEQRQALSRYFAALRAQHEAAAAAAAAAAQNNAPPPPDPQEQRPPADPSLAGEIPVFALVCPVTGIVTFVDDWGQPRSGWRVHQGTDMFAPLGTPNIAVANGTARMRVGGLAGNAIWLYTDDGHAYFYAHLDRFEGAFAPDGTRRVVQGEIVGYSGNTGNAAGGPVHTHFEIHPRNVGPINPFPLLRDMCATPSVPVDPSVGTLPTPMTAP